MANGMSSRDAFGPGNGLSHELGLSMGKNGVIARYIQEATHAESDRAKLVATAFKVPNATKALEAMLDMMSEPNFRTELKCSAKVDAETDINAHIQKLIEADWDVRFGAPANPVKGDLPDHPMPRLRIGTLKSEEPITTEEVWEQLGCPSILPGLEVLTAIALDQGCMDFLLGHGLSTIIGLQPFDAVWRGPAYVATFNLTEKSVTKEFRDNSWRPGTAFVTFA